MNPPRIYADFNAIEYLDGSRVEARMSITGYGSLASLSKQKIRLSEGLRLTLFEPGDVEVTGVAHFDPARRDPAGRAGEWVVQFRASEIRDSACGSELTREHLCFSCGENMYTHLDKVGRRYVESCPRCGTSVMEPLGPPAAQPNHSLKLDGPDGPPT